MEPKADIALIGLAVMGQNLILNMILIHNIKALISLVKYPDGEDTVTPLKV